MWPGISLVHHWYAAAAIAGYCLAYVTGIELSKTIPAQRKRPDKLTMSYFSKNIEDD